MPSHHLTFSLIAAGFLAAGTPALAARPLTIALAASVNTLDPAMTATIGTDMSVLSEIYPRLVTRDPDLKLHPGLAVSWKLLNDTTWEFDLHPGATFADGEKLDAATVAWNIDRVLDPKVAARIRSWFTLIKSVRVVNDTTVDIETREPFPALPAQLTMLMLLPPRWAAAHQPAQSTLSGGPYEMVQNVPGDHITLRANPHYWGPKPQYPEVVYRTIPEAASRIAALEAGEVDLITGFPVEEIKRIDASGKARAGSVASTRTAFLKINLSKPPMDSLALRQALNYGVDKQGIDEAIFGGRAPVAACQVLTPEYDGFNPTLKAYPYDPAKARALIKKSGIDTKKPITLEYPTAVYLNGGEVVQAIASGYESLGLKINIRPMTFSAFMNKQVKAHDMGQMSFLTYAWPTLDAGGILNLFMPGSVYDYWGDKTFGAIVAKARATVDPKLRHQLDDEATARMCAEAPVVFLYAQPVTYGESKTIDWHARGDDWIRVEDITPAH